MRLRPAQAKILAYQAGRMGISAVPGSGKTFVLTRLAAQLIADGRLDVAGGQQVLIVTYLNASVDAFQARIAGWLRQAGLPQIGYDVRTLHSLAREILITEPVAAGLAQEFPILDEGQSAFYLAHAVDGWIKDHPEAWRSFLPVDTADSPRLRARWRDITEQTAQRLIREAKNRRYPPDRILDRLEGPLRRWEEASWRAKEGAADRPSGEDRIPVSPPFLWMLAGIYQRYQTAVETQGALDFDDLVWRAADLLQQNPGLVQALRWRWPYVLEDEAQDSVPLQETLLETLAGPEGNWVRVGDPNQAVTSSFTAAHPRFFRAYLARPDVSERSLPTSGRSAPKIIGLANRLVEWACTEHPVPEVRAAAFRRQFIEPSLPGDAQPNPPDSRSTISIHVYQHREQAELPAVAAAAWEQVSQDPTGTVAILVPTNQAGYAVAAHLDALEADYDELLRGTGRAREIAAALHAVLALLAHPLEARRLGAAFGALLDIDALPGAALADGERQRVLTLLRSVFQPEALLYPQSGHPISDALPRGVATAADEGVIGTFVHQMRIYFQALSLPPDELVLAVADRIFRNEADLALAYQISGFFRALLDGNPGWHLPELVAQLEGVASGHVHLVGTGSSDIGYEPTPGRITLTTQHRAKGLEWDTVFLVGIDGFWIPGHLDAAFMGVHEFLGSDPSAEAAAQLQFLMEGDTGLLTGLSATDTAHVEVIAERLRLLYVGITRARRNLVISRSRSVSVYGGQRDSGPATALGVLYAYLRENA